MAQSPSPSESPIATDTAPPETGPTDFSKTAELVFECVREVGKERVADLELDTAITELGLGSLERLEILGLLEERFGGRFPETVLMEVETCREVVEAVETYLGGEPQARRTMATSDEIPTEYYQIDQFPECVQLRQTLGLLDLAGLANPFFHVQQGIVRNKTTVCGQELVNFGSFNYLSMSGHPAVARAAKEAVDRYGTSAGASRLVSGESELHQQLETKLAEFLGTEASLAFCSGHSTNESVIGHLVGPGDLIAYDELSHNSIMQGALLSGAARRPFAHNQAESLDQLLSKYRRDYRRVLIIIEGVYSMDGDMPSLPEFIDVKRRHKAIMMIDEAHSIATQGSHGRGIGDLFGVDRRDVEIWMGTLSKGLGSCGGFIAGTSALIQYLRYTAPAFVYAVGISPPSTAAALAAIGVLEAEPQRVVRLQERARLFLRLAKERGMNTGTSEGTAVIPVIVGNSVDCVKASEALIKRGFNVRPILHPAVEENATRLRFFINSEHTEDEIRAVADATAEVLAEMNPDYLAK